MAPLHPHAQAPHAPARHRVCAQAGQEVLQRGADVTLVRAVAAPPVLQRQQPRLLCAAGRVAAGGAQIQAAREVRCLCGVGWDGMTIGWRGRGWVGGLTDQVGERGGTWRARAAVACCCGQGHTLGAGQAGQPS